MPVKLLDLPLLGETHRFRSHRESAHAYHGFWETGPLATKEARPMKGSVAALLEPREEKKIGLFGRKNDAMARQEKLLAELRCRPLKVSEYAYEHGYLAKQVRGDIGALRRAGHTIEAIGGGCFAIRGESK